MLLDQRVVMVTGASGMLGKTLIPSLWEAGARLALPLYALPPDPSIASLRSEHHDRIFFDQADLGDPAAVHRFVGQVEGALGPVEILVNLAGGYAGGKLLEEHTPEEWDHMMDLNARTAFLTIRETLPSMKRAGFGRIVNVAAMPALRSGARRIPYAVSKRAVITLTESLAEELRGTGVTVNAVAPSVLLPPHTQGEGISTTEVASMIVHLCSPAQGGTSGNVIRLFGGM